MNALGLLLAALAAGCYDGAVAVQALEARELGTDRAGARLLSALVVRKRWLAATGLAIAGFPAHVAALAFAPLTVVQPALALGLVLLLFLGARLLHEPVRPRDLAAVAAIATGLALLAWAAPPAHRASASALTLGVALGTLAAIALLPWLARARGLVLVFAAGCAYAASGLTSTLLADALRGRDAGASAGWAAATAVVAGLGLADEMAALQRVGAARVAAGAFALQTAVPVLLAPLIAGEHWQRPVPILAGLLLVLGGSLALGTARAVSGLVSAAA